MSETQRQELAAWLMYQLGLSREDADAITEMSVETDRQALTDSIRAFQFQGIPDDEVVAWHEAGVRSAAHATQWREAGCTPLYLADLRDACTLSEGFDDDPLCRSLREGVPHEFAVLALHAGVRSVTELLDLYRRERDGDPDIRAELEVLAKLRA